MRRHGPTDAVTDLGLRCACVVRSLLAELGVRCSESKPLSLPSELWAQINFRIHTPSSSELQYVDCVVDNDIVRIETPGAYVRIELRSPQESEEEWLEGVAAVVRALVSGPLIIRTRRTMFGFGGEVGAMRFQFEDGESSWSGDGWACRGSGTLKEFAWPWFLREGPAAAPDGRRGGG